MLSLKDQIDNSRLHSVYNDNDIANLELYDMLRSSGALKCLRESAVGLGVRAKIPQMWEHPLNVKIGIAGTD